MVDFSHPTETNIPHKDAWKLFRIISEFVDGFDTLADAGPSISIFGSSRLKKSNPYYKVAFDVSLKIAQRGFAVITGAGPSIMEAANKGAKEAAQPSIGLIIDLPFESEPNSYIDPKLSLRFRYFFVRKVMFVRYAQGFVFLPGGLGTLDEMFEVLTLIQTKKTHPVPVYLVGKTYWEGLVEWLRSVVKKHGCITQEDLDLFTITDDTDEVADGLLAAYKARSGLVKESLVTTNLA